jgi:hypothetical protein
MAQGWDCCPRRARCKPDFPGTQKSQFIWCATQRNLVISQCAPPLVGTGSVSVAMDSQ